MGAEADLTLDPVQYNLKITLKNMVKSMMPNFICERHQHDIHMNKDFQIVKILWDKVGYAYQCVLTEVVWKKTTQLSTSHLTNINPLNPELNPICYLLALLGAHHFLHVSRIRVKLLTFRRLMSYTYGAPILDVSRSHTTTQHSR